MDPDAIAPMVVLVTMFVTVGTTVILRGPLGKAIADRVAGRVDRGSPEVGVQELRQEIEELKIGLAEVQERLDFTERVLARGRAPELPGAQS